MPLTVDDVRQIRAQKAGVNHATYKTIYTNIETAITRRAARGDTSIDYVVPPFIPGRPMYQLDHAIRYCREKLHLNGFHVSVKDSDVLLIDWKPQPPGRPPQPPGRPQPQRNNIRVHISTNTPTYTPTPAAPMPRSVARKSKVSTSLNQLKQKLGI
jgi:hypothetical protein